MEGKRPFLLVRAQVDPEVLPEFDRWYRAIHLNIMLQVPGVVSAYRLRAQRAGPNWVALYKLASEAAIEDLFNSSQAQQARIEWQRWMPHINELSVEVYTTLGALPAYHHWN